MCGFAGRVNVTEPVSRAQLEAMSALVAHRGPDGDGLWIDGIAGLAHRRLAIVDRDGGAQPITGEGNRVVLAYNGEVYNHRELRHDLEPRGHVFRSRCDTEAVLHAHEEYGVRAASRLRGMFAYAAWDRGRRRLTLVRDRLGVKPLYYAHLPGGDLLFATDLRALFVEPGVDRALDEDALAAYLALRYVPGPATIARGVRKLLPGCALTWHDGRVALERWWQVPAGDVDPRDVPPPPPTSAEAAGRLCTLLDEVVGLRRMGDVPIGAFLSGGVDSTLVAALLARQARAAGAEPPRTFAVGYLGRGVSSCDELPWARRAAAAVGSRHREVAITAEQVADAAGRIAWDLDEPLGDPAAVPLWFLARRARQEVAVVLSGEGADEIFAGYAVYRRLLQAERARRLPGVGPIAAFAARFLVGGDGRTQRALRLCAGPLEARYRGVARALSDDHGLVERPAEAIARALAPAWARALLAPTPLSRALAFDQQVWLPDDLLTKADKTTMAHALELRVPLLDHHLVEEVAAWPDAWKLQGDTGKAILRRAAEGIVPPEILGRPKLGFATPAAAWLRGAVGPLAQDALLSSASLAAERGSRVVEALLAEHTRGRDRSGELWALLSLELWRHETARVPLVAAEPLALEADASASTSMAG